jgi:hypothetical protein
VKPKVAWVAAKVVHPRVHGASATAAPCSRMTRVMCRDEAGCVIVASQVLTPHSVVLIPRRFGVLTVSISRTLWPLVRKRTIPTERPPLLGDI